MKGGSGLRAFMPNGVLVFFIEFQLVRTRHEQGDPLKVSQLVATMPLVLFFDAWRQKREQAL